MPGHRPCLAALALTLAAAAATGSASEPVNLAPLAAPSTSFISGHEKLAAIQDGHTPAHSRDKRHGTHGNWPRTGTQWVQYDWPGRACFTGVQVFWFEDGGGLKLPTAARLKYWDGREFVPVPGAEIGVKRDVFNEAKFPEVTTTRLRLEFDSDGGASTAVLEWRVLDSGNTPNFAPKVQAGPDRSVILRGATYLDGQVQDDGKPAGGPASVRWSRLSGPGRVTFQHPAQAATQARFSRPGLYQLQFAARDGQAESSDTVTVNVEPDPPARPLEPVWTTRYAVTSPFWRARFKAMTVSWLPYCAGRISDPALPIGGLENFTQAARKLEGRPAQHTGAPFANAWVYNTFESICLALLVDAGGDAEVLRAQARLRGVMEDWLPRLLAAQEPDGYLQTYQTITGAARWANNNDCEDYNAGYFIGAAIAHYWLEEGRDRRMLEAAVRLADCYDRNLGPGSGRRYFGWHQELEQTLVRLARLLEQTGGDRGRSRRYVALARHLLEARRNGDEYDQSHLPVTRQYEAVGHAVRAVYGCSGMADIAMETGDPDYYSAVKSLWSSLTHRKYYVTGGIGSGETSEGFGPDFSLPNQAYCESCAGCGLVFFQHKMQLAWHEAVYADLAEETLFNNVLGGLDLEGRNFYYPNPLDTSTPRYPWHVCPCCIGNIPRTLFQLPTWAYSLGPGQLDINQYFGSRVRVGSLGNTPVEITQDTDYPWSGRVLITVNPSRPKSFTLRLRVPSRQPSQLYSADPPVRDPLRLTLNGRELAPEVKQGYAILRRTWKPGDQVALDLPLPVQRIKADPRVEALRGRVALRRGPMIYTFESVDQDLETRLRPGTALEAEWRAGLLGGVMVIHTPPGTSPRLLAVPNYARQNRGGRSIVWIQDQ